VVHPNLTLIGGEDDEDDDDDDDDDDDKIKQFNSFLLKILFNIRMASNRKSTTYENR
jgi:hypothetical protein